MQSAQRNSARPPTTPTCNVDATINIPLVTDHLAVRGNALLRTAVLLAPGREAGEDLLQEALERLLRKWHKVDGDPEAATKKISTSPFARSSPEPLLPTASSTSSPPRA